MVAPGMCATPPTAGPAWRWPQAHAGNGTSPTPNSRRAGDVTSSCVASKPVAGGVTKPSHSCAASPRPRPGRRRLTFEGPALARTPAGGHGHHSPTGARGEPARAALGWAPLGAGGRAPRPGPIAQSFTSERGLYLRHGQKRNEQVF